MKLLGMLGVACAIAVPQKSAVEAKKHIDQQIAGFYQPGELTVGKARALTKEIVSHIQFLDKSGKGEFEGKMAKLLCDIDVNGKCAISCAAEDYYSEYRVNFDKPDTNYKYFDEIIQKHSHLGCIPSYYDLKKRYSSDVRINRRLLDSARSLLNCENCKLQRAKTEWWIFNCEGLVGGAIGFFVGFAIGCMYVSYYCKSHFPPTLPEHYAQNQSNARYVFFGMLGGCISGYVIANIIYRDHHVAERDKKIKDCQSGITREQQYVIDAERDLENAINEVDHQNRVIIVRRSS